MPQIDLEILLDQPDRSYAPGSLVTGRVVVRAGRAVECYALSVVPRWSTRGEGARNSGEGAKTLLFQGNWTRGQRETYPFSVPAPREPLSYDGHLLSVSHNLVARAVMPNTADVTTYGAYRVVPPPLIGHRHRDGKDLRKPKPGTEGSVPVIGYVVAAFVGLVFLLLVGAHPFLAVVLPLLLLYVFHLVRRNLAEVKTGQVIARVARRAEPGGAIPVSVTFKPEQAGTLHSVQARLIGRERCHKGSGNERTTQTHVFHDARTVIGGELAFQAGHTVSLGGDVPVPLTSACTMRVPDNEIAWNVEVILDIAMWPDWTNTVRVTIAPIDEPASAEPAARAETAASRVVSRLLAGPWEEKEIKDGDTVTRVKRRETQTADDGVHTTTVEIETETIWEGGDGEDGATSYDLDRIIDVPMEVGGDEGEPVASDAAPPEPEPAAPAPTPAVEEPAAREEPAPPASTSLVEAIERVSAADAFDGSRKDLLKALAPTPYRFDLVVERVGWTSSFHAPAEYRRGRTVHGVLADTKTAVEVRLPEAVNDRAGRLEIGSTVAFTGHVSNWDDFAGLVALNGTLD